MLESSGKEGVGDHDGKQPDGDTHTFGHTGVPPPTGRLNLQGQKKHILFEVLYSFEVRQVR